MATTTSARQHPVQVRAERPRRLLTRWHLHACDCRCANCQAERASRAR